MNIITNKNQNMKYLTLFYLFFLIAGHKNYAQTEKLTKYNIKEWIDQKKPVFITGISTVSDSKPKTTPAHLHNAFSFIDKTNLQSNQTNVYSSIAYLKEHYHNELYLLPQGTKGAVYPISIINDSIIICLSNPSNPEKRPLIVFSSSAIERGEISGRPIEFEENNIINFIYSIRNAITVSDLSNLECLVESILKKYNIQNEFTLQDYLAAYVNEYQTLIRKSNTLTTRNNDKNNPNDYYIDFTISIENFDFTSSTFPIYLKQIDKVSKTFEGYSENINFYFLNEFIVDKSHFSSIYSDLDGSKENNYYQGNNDKLNLNYKMNIPMNIQKARELANKLNENRIATLRLYLSPLKYRQNSKKPLFANCETIIVPFTTENYQIVL